MNTRRIHIVLFILFGVCATLAYLIGSFRPFAPGAKFSNLPPPLTATHLDAALVPVSPTSAATLLVEQASSSTSTSTTEVRTQLPSSTTPNTAEVPPQLPSYTATRIVKTVTRRAPTGTPTRSRVQVSHQPVFATFTPSPKSPQRVTRIARATFLPTETGLTDLSRTATLQTAERGQLSQSAIATQTSVPARQTLWAISTRAFSTPILPRPDLERAIDKTTNFLLIGTDSRTDDPTWVPNTDVLMVLFLDSMNRRAALLSLPRDLLVAIPGQQAFRINSAYHYGWTAAGVEGGVNVLKQILRDDFEIRIDHWALIDFDGLSSIIDTLGGIQVNVPCALSDTIDLQSFTIPAGNVQMDYLTAKRYVQSRYTTSDTSRNHRQQRVLWAMAKKALDLNAPERVPLLYDQLRQNVATDMNLFSMIGLIPAVYQLDLQNHPERLRARVLEAPAVYPWVSTSGAWLYMPEYDLIRQELDEIFDSPQVALNQATPAECPVAPATRQPTDVPTVRPTEVTVTPEGATATPAVEDTLSQVPETAVAEATPTETLAALPTETPTVEVTPTEMPTEAPTVEPTSTETPTIEPTPTETPTETATVEPTPTETPTETPLVVMTPTETTAVQVTPGVQEGANDLP